MPFCAAERSGACSSDMPIGLRACVSLSETHTVGTAVVEAPKSLKQIFSEGPNFAAIKTSGQDQGRVNLPLAFSERSYLFHSPGRCCSRFDAAADAGVRGGGVMDNGAPIFKALTELNTSRTVDEKARCVRSRVRLTWKGKYTASVSDAVAPRPMCI